MSDAKPEELVQDKKHEHDYGQWIKPEFFAQESSNEENLNDTVAQQVKGREVLRTDGETLRRLQQIARYEVARIFRKFILRDGNNKP